MTEFAGNHRNVDFADLKTALLAQHPGASVTGIDIVVAFDAHTGFFKEEYSKIGASIQQGNVFFRYYRDGYSRMRDSIDAIFVHWCALAVPPCAYSGINAQFMMMGRYIDFDRGLSF